MSLGIVAAFVLGLSGNALAQVPSGDPFAWATPSAEDQLAADPTIIPLGKGAIFVPSISGPANEPSIMVVSGDQVLDVTVGQRILLDPGSYVVIVTSGTPAQGVGVSVDVREGETTLVPARWGALRIEVTDDRRVPHRGSYEIIRADTREPYGTGFGADTLQGESLATWLLPPGIYRIVRPGSNYRALRDFATVYVSEGAFVRYRLVSDPATGEFRGAGVLMPDEFGSPGEVGRRWFSSLVIGADATLSQSSNVVGVFNHTRLEADLFVDFQLARNFGANHFAALGQIEEGISQVRPQDGEELPVIKSRDRLRADLLYTRSAHGRLGPYVRTAGETQAFGTDVLVTEDTTIVRELSDGTSESESVLANETFHVSDAFEPSIIREGVGLNARFFNSRFATFNWRIGFGARQNLYSGAFLLEDDPSTSGVEYQQVDSFTQEGIESTIVAVFRLPGSVVYATDVELFGDFETFSQPSIEWRNTLTLHLARHLSLNYYATFDHLPQVVDVPQLEQSLLLRASWAVL